MIQNYSLTYPSYIALAIFILFFSNSINSQVGIGTITPKEGAILDVDSPDKGMYVPRLNISNPTSLGPITGITNPASAEGLLIYNTNTTVGPGLFFWSGSTWDNVANTSKNLWKMDGNAGTTAGTNFIGTTDNVNLQFKTRNTSYFEITAGAAANRGRFRAFTDGDEAAPIYSWSNDANTGMYRIANDVLGFSTSGNERFRLGLTEAVLNESSNNYDLRVESDGQQNMFFVDASTDRIGIQTNTPGYTFHVLNSGNIGTTSLGYFENRGTNGVSFSARNSSVNNIFNTIEGITNYNGTGNYPAAVYGFARANTGYSTGVEGISNSSDSYAVFGSIPTTGTWLGFGGIFVGALGYANGIYNLSDERAKKNIKKIDSALENIMNIQGVSYNYDMKKFNSHASEDSHTYYGFIAQNIKEFLPNAVAEKAIPFRDEQEDNNFETPSNHRQLLNVVDYTAIVPVLVEALKEQQAQIIALQTQINNLQK